MIQLIKYRDPWLAEGFREYIGFYNREFYCLDNFSSFKIMYEGYLYSSVEEAYQTLGFITAAPDVAERIKASASAYEAKQIAHENMERRRGDWDVVKVEIMENLLRAKLEQHPYVRKKLLETRDCVIVEDSPTDSFWGCGIDRSGCNHMGKIWMKLWAELFDETTDIPKVGR